MADVVQSADGRIHMVDPSGQAQSIDADEYHRAVAAGWRPQSADEYNSGQIAREQSTLGNTLLAAGEGALETATLGAGTAAATMLGGEDYRQAAAERAEYHPIARGVGQVAGAVLPGLLSGGEGTVGALARATPAGALSRVGGALEGAVGGGLESLGIGGRGAGLLGAMTNRAIALGAQGALEGAAYGLGGSLADSALQGTDWTAERALAALEDGALYGLGTGAAIGGGSELASRLGRKAVDAMLGEGKSLRETVQGWADRQELRGVIGDDAQALNKITRNGSDMQRIPELVEKLRSRGVTEAEDVPAAIQQQIEEASGVAKSIAQLADEQGIRPNTRALIDDVHAQVKRLRDIGTPDHLRVARQLERSVQKLEDSIASAPEPPPIHESEIADLSRNYEAKVNSAEQFIAARPDAQTVRDYLTASGGNETYLQMNGQLRGTVPADPIVGSKIAELQRLLQDAKNAGEAAPGVGFRGTALPRSLVSDLEQAIGDGTTRKFDGFTSISQRRDSALFFAGAQKAEEEPVLFRIRQQSGIPVAALGDTPGEAEVLLPYGTNFRVLGSRLEDMYPDEPGFGGKIRVFDLAESEPTTEAAAPSFSELARFKTGLGETQNWAKAQRNIAQNEISKLYGSVARTLEDTAAEISPEAGEAYRGAMRDMDDFITIRGAMKREAVRASKAKLVQGMDLQNGIGGALVSLVMGHGGPMAALTGIATSVASKFVRERGSEAVGKLAQWALKTESGMRAAAQKMAGLGTFDRAALRTAIQLNAPPERKEQEFEGVQEMLTAFQNDPSSVSPRIERLIKPIAHQQPEVAIAMGKQITGDLQYLSTLAPKAMSRADTSLTPTKEKPVYSSREKIRLVNASRALASPQSVWTGIADGKVNWDGIEALKARRPKQWADMRAHVIQACAEAPEPLPMRRRVLLGLAFDFQADWSMQNVAQIQALGQQAPDTGNGKPAAAGITTGEQMALPSQKGEAA